jgi:hypothetical protein
MTTIQMAHMVQTKDDKDTTAPPLNTPADNLHNTITTSSYKP